MAKKNMTLEEKLEEAIVKKGHYEVPENWVWTKLIAISELVTGNTPSKNNPEYYGDEIPFIKPNDLEQGRRLTESKEMLSELGRTKARVIPRESIAVCCIGSIGKCAYLEVDGATNQQINSIIPIDIIPLYVYYYVLSEYFQSAMVSNSSATTISIINKSKMGELLIPIPPLKEQERIVNRIESLFEKLDKAKELIEEAREGFENRKAAILEKAFRGELTREWREKRTDNISGEEYLKNIAQMREEMYSNLVEVSKKNGGKKPTKIHKVDLEYSLISGCDNWIKTKLYNVTYDFRYGTSSKSDYMFNGKPVIRIPNLVDSRISHDDLKFLQEVEVDCNNKVETGDILIVRSNGSQSLVGKTAIIEEKDSNYAFASYLIRLRPSGIDSKYLYYVLNSASVKEQFYSKSKSTSGINNINTEELGNSIISLPPIEEQKEIVRILDKLLEEESKIEELTQLEDSIELIKKSILAKAFRGELRTHCEEDGNALELLKEVLVKN